MSIDKAMLDRFQEIARAEENEERFIHTLGVRKMAEHLGKYCLPDKINELACAAIFHDTTKSFDRDMNVLALTAEGDEVSEEDYNIPEVLHSYTGAYSAIFHLLDEDDDTRNEIANAIRKHTVGDGNMSVFDEILFIADFIEEGRKYDTAIETREFLLGGLREGKIDENVNLLHRACLMEIEHTLEHLKLLGRRIHSKTIEARDGLLAKIK